MAMSAPPTRTFSPASATSASKLTVKAAPLFTRSALTVRGSLTRGSTPSTTSCTGSGVVPSLPARSRPRAVSSKVRSAASPVYVHVWLVGVRSPSTSSNAPSPPSRTTPASSSGSWLVTVARTTSTARAGRPAGTTARVSSGAVKSKNTLADAREVFPAPSVATTTTSRSPGSSRSSSGVYSKV